MGRGGHVMSPTCVPFLCLLAAHTHHNLPPFRPLFVIFRPTLQQKSDLCIPILGFARSQSQFPHHVSVSDLFIPRIGPHIFCKQNRQIYRGNTYKSLTDSWMWKLGHVAAQFLFWEYLFRIFYIGSLQCRSMTTRYWYVKRKIALTQKIFFSSFKL